MTKNLDAFLAMIRMCDAGAPSPEDKECYQALFGWHKGNGKIFNDFSDHPKKFFSYKDHSGKIIRTSASGAYQMIYGTYEELHRRGIMKDFSPTEQDKGAIELIKEKEALNDIDSGRFNSALNKIKSIWASIPGAGLNQPERSYSQVKSWYESAGGVIV